MSNFLAIAADLAKQAGAPPPTAVTPIEGGRNNRVFRTEHADMPRVMKLYHRDSRDPRDRLDHEWAFLVYAARKGATAMPRPLARTDVPRAALLSFAPGVRIGADKVGAHLDKAVDFVLEINARPHRFEGLPLASEACFSIAEHLATVDRRVLRLEGLDPTAPLVAEVAALVRERLAPAWEKTRLRAAATPSLDEVLPSRAVILSPSDFGFHNALVDGEQVTFIDFEYAGQDDPAKLVGDTFAQPDIPAPAQAFTAFARDLIGGLGLEEDHLERCHRLRPVYQLKWACIMLNEFLPIDAGRRAAAGLARTDQSCARQIARVHAKLDELEALQES
jgi:hypothetical protein